MGMDKMKLDACGKINLMLNISGVREDGYHTLETVMQTVSLHDVVEVRRRVQKGIALRCNLPYIPTDGRNIAWKAADCFIERTGFDGGVEIDIRKTIPVGGGMAGGSTDAAAVLRGLNEMCGCPMNEKALEEAALTLGADVPFCLKRGTYLCEGIGEIMTRLPDLPRCFIVVCKPRASVSSRSAYGVYDAWPSPRHIDAGQMIAGLQAKDLRAVAAAVGNSFEDPIGAECPEIPAIRQRLLEMGALNAAMTGSGSVVFGLFDDAGRAHKAKAALRASRYRTFCVRPVRR